DDAIAAFDQIIRNRQADFADADQTNRVHDRFQLHLQTSSVSNGGMEGAVMLPPPCGGGRRMK
ncbi:MAG: hypothetical protein WAM72_28355, partial [Xanthobacteraceae bacterium]